MKADRTLSRITHNYAKADALEPRNTNTCLMVSTDNIDIEQGCQITD